MNFSKLGNGIAIAGAFFAQACVGVIGGEEQGGEQEALSPVPRAEEPAPEAAKDSAGDSESTAAPEEQPARSCADLTDEVVLAAVYGGPKVPAGYSASRPPPP